MQLSSGSPIPDGLLAANVLLSEKPRLGVPSWNPALHQGISEANCTAAIGLPASQSLNRVQSRYTGKERDTESGLDYFGARYYASNMGRWMSPDWNSDPRAVPYADFENPQSLNLYSYVRNNPLSHTDPDGHHQECAPDTSSTGKDRSITVTAGACHEVADHWYQIPSAWLQNVKARMDANAIAHAPPPQKPNDNDALNDLANVMMGLVPVGPSKSPGNLQRQVEKGQAPKSVDRVDKGRGPFEKDHIEFKSGDALNQDGTWKHGGRELTGEEAEWVQKNGWNPPPK